jgi:SpoIID/LytB domain protein
MLIPNVIPEEEPQINVGIILPEDNINRIVLFIPENQTYNIGSKEFILDLAPGSKARIELLQNHYFITTDEDIVEMKGELSIWPEQKAEKLSNKSGIRLAPVIAGRGFHWQKKIEVFLPGSLTIRPVDDDLILINTLSLEEYVMCVATSEMGASCPEGLIESQTIVARSWLLANVEQKHITLGMDVCNDDCCQRYQGTTFLSEQSVLGALNTHGKVILFEDAICDARYSKSCGGMMEGFEYIWPGKGHPYLAVKMDSIEETEVVDLKNENDFIDWINSVPDCFCSSKNIDEKELPVYLGKVDVDGKYFRWQLTLRQTDLTKSLNKYAQIMAIEVIKIEVLSRGGSGRINRLNIHYYDIANKQKLLEIDSEYNVRRFLSDKFLYSSAFTITPLFETQNDIPDAFILTGAGWGHGVGLCQIGALGMALQDYSTEAILKHYYPGSRLEKIY